jgi:hypothetical protein
MCSQAIDQQFSPSVLGTAQVFYCPQPLASGNRTLELFPVLWEKYSGLLPGYTLNNCILLNATSRRLLFMGFIIASSPIFNL